MRKEIKTVVYDDELRLEAYRFEGMVQSFPNHFHEYYVIGFVEDGERCLSCKNNQYTISRGNVVLFNPGDSHACVQTDEGTLDYRGLNITKEVMLDLAEEVTGRRELPGFAKPVIFDDEVTCCLRPLHEMIMNGSLEFGKEENLLLLLSRLMQKYGQSFESCIPECREEIEKACAFMERHYSERIYLDQICRCAGLSKSALLRAFAKSKGVTPYLYLENIRIGKAKKLLEQGVPPIEAAMRTGFTEVVGADVIDQSGNAHLGIIEFPVPILRGSPKIIKEIREKLYQPEFQDLTVVDFSDLAQGCKTYVEGNYFLISLPC